ncbi:DUF6544 family protein [Tessaracoccus sp.]
MEGVVIITETGKNPQRMFIMHATRSGLPVEVLHLYHDAAAIMRVKVLSAVQIFDAFGSGDGPC